MKLKICTLFALTSIAGCGDESMMMTTRRDTGVTIGPDGMVMPPVDSGSGPCIDSDNDNISDSIEGVSDVDSDGRPNKSDDDSDGDGFSDADEARRSYTNYEMMAREPLTCGRTPDDCDGDARPNYVDFDSDDDGLSDAEERMAGSNPCSNDSDMDGVPDLTEIAAMSSPRDGMSRPAEGTLYVTLPYATPANPRMHEFREFEFQTRIKNADIFFMVDTTGSMQRTIDTLRNTLTGRIIPGIAMALRDGNVRYGVADFRDIPNGQYGAANDWILRVRQSLNADPMFALNAVRAMTAATGGDWPESQVEAIYQVLEGTGITGHEMDETPRLPMGGMGWVGRMVAARDCAEDVNPFGWGCFRPGRVPIILLFSDADWHNGILGSYPYSNIRGLQNYSTLRNAMVARGAYFVGIDVGQTRDTYSQSEMLARDTNTVDNMGMPIVFNNPGGGDVIADSVVMAVSSIVNGTRQNITTRTDPDGAEMRLPAGRTTGDFIKAVTPLRGMPEAPMGYDRRDETTFFNVAPSTRVTFRVDFYNDFYAGGDRVQLFRATIVVLGRAGSEVDRKPVFIIVPSAIAAPG